MTPLSAERLEKLDSYWRATNYLAAAQFYLKENPLLREPLRPEHLKPRIRGHWGSAPGLNLIYVHLNRLIQDTGARFLFLTGPGHCASAILANVYLEGTYSEFFPEITHDLAGLTRFCRQFSSPGGVPSHVSAMTPGSIHEGGELGYSMLHAFGAVFDRPELIAVAVVSDGEAETGPLSGSWQSIHFLNPKRDGAVLPILHINDGKLSGPTIFGRMEDEELRLLFSGFGYQVLTVAGSDPAKVHPELAQALDQAYEQIRSFQKEAQESGVKGRPRWPLILLRTPDGWTGPKMVDGVPLEGTWRAHRSPLMDAGENPEHLRLLEGWLRSYKPEELFEESGRLRSELEALAPKGDLRMGASPYANGGKLLVELDLPDFANYAVSIKPRGAVDAEATRVAGSFVRDVIRRNPNNFRVFCPDETDSNRLGAVFEVTDRCLVSKVLPGDDHLSPDGRVMEILSEHACEGWLEGYLWTGRHGLLVSYEAFATVLDSMASQHAKWLKLYKEIPWRHPVASLNYLLTSHVWRQEYDGYTHQGPGFIDTLINKKGDVVRIYLPPDANTLLSTLDHCLRSRHYVNLIIAEKQPALQWLSLEEARAHCARGAGIWDWAGNDGGDPDIVLGCAGDVPTLEAVAASWLLQTHIPELRVRVVNVVDLMSLSPPAYHPHGMDTQDFVNLFTEEKEVIFAFHGYRRMVHDLVHGRPNPARFHVRGYVEEGTTTTSFDMVVLNEMSRYHLAIEALRRVPRLASRAQPVIDLFEKKLAEHRIYVKSHLDDLPEIQNWTWSAPHPAIG
ncbi:phosphoketolase [Methylacidimicrobium sp. B4]|uniref:phosphoketolase family protein n=1 Tax=Methylacidimicrobium sp. B4 TaxID=2796139 RepID=UPI001A8F537B|nr:phosphoketolase family protein [Methylacidimicrobium sp. B4]QSR85365.1 phosphoketolase family protein [Methylacidimicrobium sp. B4]